MRKQVRRLDVDPGVGIVLDVDEFVDDHQPWAVVTVRLLAPTIEGTL
jgi:hypothetical protein